MFLGRGHVGDCPVQMEIFEWNLRSGSGDRCLSGGGSGPQDLIDGNLSGGIGLKSERKRSSVIDFPQKTV